jgi:hypothetical protein
MREQHHRDRERADEVETEYVARFSHASNPSKRTLPRAPGP